MISHIESILYSDKEETSVEGQRIQHLKYVLIYYNKDEDNSPKNYNQNNSYISKIQTDCWYLFEVSELFI